MALSVGTLVGYVDMDTSAGESALSGFKDKLSSAGGTWGKVIGGAGAAAGGMFGASLAGAMNLEPSRDRVAAALDLTTEQAARAGKVSGGLFADAWGESAAEVDGAVEAVMSSIKGMRGASEADLRAVTEAALTLSTTMGVDVARASQVAGNMIANGLAKNGTQAFDLLQAAMSKVPVQLREDLLDATDEYGQFFNQLGMTGSQAMSMLAAGAEKGMYGIDKAGDAVKEFTIRATDMSASSVTAYETIGLNARKMSDDILAGGKRASTATQKIIDGLLGIESPSKRAEAAIALFGTPLEDLGTKDIPVFLRSLQAGKQGLGDWSQATERAGKALNDNATTNLTSFGRQVKAVFVQTIGGQVLPMVNQWTAVLAAGVAPALSVLGDALATTGGFLTDHATVIGVVAGLIAAVFIPHLIALGVTQTVTAAKSVAAWAVTKAQAVAAAAAHSVAVLKIVAGWVMLGARAAASAVIQAAAGARVVATWVLMGAKAMLGAAKMAAAWLIALGPIGIAIAAIAGVVALVVKYWDEIKAATVKVWRAVSDAVKEACGWVMDAVKAAFAFLVKIFLNFTGPGLIIKHWNTIKAATSAAWSFIKSLVSAAINGVQAVIGNVMGAIRGVISGAWNAVKSATSAVWNGIKSLVATAVGNVLSAVERVQAVVGKVRDFFGRAKDAAADKLGALVDFVRGIPGKILSAIGDLGSLLYNTGASILQGLIDGVTDKIGDLKGKLSSVTGLIPDWKGPMEVDAKLLAPNGRAIMQSLVDGFDAGVPFVRRSLADLTSALPAMAGSPAMPALAPAGGEGIDYDRLAAALAARDSGGDPEVVDLLEKLLRAVKGHPDRMHVLMRKDIG